MVRVLIRMGFSRVGGVGALLLLLLLLVVGGALALAPAQGPAEMRAFFGVGVDALVLIVVVAAATAADVRVVGRVGVVVCVVEVGVGFEGVVVVRVGGEGVVGYGDCAGGGGGGGGEGAVAAVVEEGVDGEGGCEGEEEAGWVCGVSIEFWGEECGGGGRLPDYNTTAYVALAQFTFPRAAVREPVASFFVVFAVFRVADALIGPCGDGGEGCEPEDREKDIESGMRVRV